MKYLLMILTLFVTACSSSDSTEINDLKSQIRDTKYELQSCKNSLDVYRGSSGSSKEESTPEPEAPAEPQYETVSYIEVDGTKCYKSSQDEDHDVACGMSFWECKDGVVRRCMVNVKYKIKEEQKLVNQEEN